MERWAGRASAARVRRGGIGESSRMSAVRFLWARCGTSKFVLAPTCVGVHDRSVVWSGVRMRGYPPRCVTSKSIRLDEFCDACQGRVGPVLDCFQSCQSDEWWEDNEHFIRVSSRNRVHACLGIIEIVQNSRGCFFFYKCSRKDETREYNPQICLRL